MELGVGARGDSLMCHTATSKLMTAQVWRSCVFVKMLTFSLINLFFISVKYWTILTHSTNEINLLFVLIPIITVQM